MLVGYERATGGIIARPSPKAGPALRSGIKPERPFPTSGNRPGPTATSAQSRNLNEAIARDQPVGRCHCDSVCPAEHSPMGRLITGTCSTSEDMFSAGRSLEGLRWERW
jgi:hypothetical protein